MLFIQPSQLRSELGGSKATHIVGSAIQSVMFFLYLHEAGLWWCSGFGDERKVLLNI